MYDYEDEEDDLFGPPPQASKPAKQKGIDFKKLIIRLQFHLGQYFQLLYNL